MHSMQSMQRSLESLCTYSPHTQLVFDLCEEIITYTREFNTHFNPLMLNGFTHHYHLGESTLIFRGFGCDFYILFHFFFMKFL